MAVSIDTVYQRVLAITNKEQRGYITPQEFNLLANQAQMDIFEQYFYDINQFDRLPGNNTEYSNMLNILDEKISAFETSTVVTGSNPFTLPTTGTLYRLGIITYTGGTNDVEVEKITENDILPLTISPLTKPTAVRPLYTRTSDTTIKVYPSTLTTPNHIYVNYIKLPSEVKWAYVVVNEQALYNASASDLQDFELHRSEETNLVLKISELAGITINKPGLAQLVGQEELQKIQQQKA